MGAAPNAAAVWGRTEQQDFRSRVRGTLLGGALGDTLGAPLDGLTLDGIHAEHGDEGLKQLVPVYGRTGAITAATQLTLFTVDGLIRAQVRRDTGAWHPPTDVHRAYLRWLATQRDWGPDLRRKEDGWLAREEWLYSRRGAAQACLLGLGNDVMGTLDRPKNLDADGAEAATRSAPFGLLVGWEPQLVFQLSVECAVHTHGAAEAYLAAGAYAVLVHALARGDSLDAAVQRALALLAARPGTRPSRTRSSTRSAPYGRACRPRRGSGSWWAKGTRPGCSRPPCTARSSATTSGTDSASPCTTTGLPRRSARCAGACSGRCTGRRRCRPRGWRRWRVGPRSWSLRTTSRWR